MYDVIHMYTWEPFVPTYYGDSFYLINNKTILQFNKEVALFHKHSTFKSIINFSYYLVIVIKLHYTWLELNCLFNNVDVVMLNM